MTTSVVVEQASELPCEHVLRGEPAVVVVVFAHSPFLRSLTGFRSLGMSCCMDCLVRFSSVADEILSAARRANSD